MILFRGNHTDKGVDPGKLDRGCEGTEQKQRLKTLIETQSRLGMSGPRVWPLKVIFCFYLSLIICCSVAKSGPTLCDPMDCSISGFPELMHIESLPSFGC